MADFLNDYGSCNLFSTKVNFNYTKKACLIVIKRLKKERHLIRQNNTIYKFSIKIYFSSIGQDKSKLQKQISKLLI